MAKSCQATLVLAGHSEAMQMKGFEFGKEIALAWQVGVNSAGKLGLMLYCMVAMHWVRKDY